MAQKFAVWCPNRSVLIEPPGVYVLAPNLESAPLIETQTLVKRQIQLVEGNLLDAERALDRASRNEMVNRSKVRGDLFSASRSMRGMRHSFSKMGTISKDLTYQMWNRELTQLNQLLWKVEDAIAACSSGKQSAQEDSKVGDERRRVGTSNPKARLGRYCPACGTPASEEMKYCGECGSVLSRLINALRNEDI